MLAWIKGTIANEKYLLSLDRALVNLKRIEDIRDEDYKYWYSLLLYWKFKHYEAKGDSQMYLWLKKAYKEGSNDAAAQYGYYYYTGQGIANGKIDKDKATRFFERSYSDYSQFVEYLLGQSLLEDPIELTESERKKMLYHAIDYFKNSISRSRNLKSKIELANCYLELGENLEEASSLYKESLDGIELKEKL